jgi:hypothetical protein
VIWDTEWKVFWLHILKLVLIHAEVMPQFVHKRPADLLAGVCLARTDRFDVLRTLR